jgi:hypothetical protein
MEMIDGGCKLIDRALLGMKTERYFLDKPGAEILVFITTAACFGIGELCLFYPVPLSTCNPTATELNRICINRSLDTKSLLGRLLPADKTTHYQLSGASHTVAAS